MTIRSLCTRIAPRNDQRVAESARVGSVGGGPSHLLRRLKIHATGKIDLLDPGHDFDDQEPTANLAHQFSQGLVVWFDVPNPQSHRFQVGYVVLHRLRACDAGDPADEAIQLRWHRTVPCQVAQTEAPTRCEDPRNFCRGSLFAWKRAVGALADHRIK